MSLESSVRGEPLEHAAMRGPEPKPLAMQWMFAGREERPRWIAERYAEFFGDSVLDVGCWQRQLRQYLPAGVRYVGVDKDGAPDEVLDLETARLPFPDRSFHTVVCTEVLEHLECIHAVMDELLRVAARYVIVSLPNNYAAVRVAVPLGLHAAPKFYGLPLEPPADRHRWFFNFTQAEEFIRYRSARAGARVVDVYALENVRAFWLKAVVKRVLARDVRRRRNLFATAIYALIETRSR